MRSAHARPYADSPHVACQLPMVADSLGQVTASVESAERKAIHAVNKERTNFDAAMREIIEYGEGLRSERFPLSQMRIEGDRLFTKDRELRLDVEGRRRLCRLVSAPSDYLESLPEKLRDRAFAYHLAALGLGEGKLNDHSSRLIYRDDNFVDVARADLLTLGARDVLHAVRDGFGGDADSFQVERMELDNEAFSLDLVSPRVAVEVRPGDVIRAGVRLEHAYTGERATTVFAFVVRLICSNGMVHRECVGSRKTSRTRRLNSDRDDAGMLQIEQIRGLTEEVRKGLEPKLAAIRKLADERASAGEMKQLLQQARMHSSDLMVQLEDSWEVEGNEQTAFGLFNALTRLATHGTRVSPRQRAILARLAGIYANRSSHLCPHCFSVLNAH